MARHWKWNGSFYASRYKVSTKIYTQMLLRSLKLHFLAVIKYHVFQLLSKTPVPYIHMFVANTENSMTCMVFSKEPLENEKKNSAFTPFLLLPLTKQMYNNFAGWGGDRNFPIILIFSGH
jgi:hypothetical protein